MEFLNTVANSQQTNDASFPRDAADLNYRKQPRQTEVTRNCIQNQLIIPVTVNAARPSCQWSQQTCYTRQRYYGPAPDKRSDPLQWWKQTGEMENNDGLDGGKGAIEYSFERQCRDTRLKWGCRKVWTRRRKDGRWRRRGCRQSNGCVVVKMDGEMEKGGIDWWRSEGAGYYPASIYSSQGWLDV